MEEIQLRKLVGREIIVAFRIFNSQVQPTEATLLGVETGGVWIESQEATDLLLEKMKKDMLERTPIFFLPFSAIAFIVELRNVPAISSKVVED